jgi:hypothetical protein
MKEKGQAPVAHTYYPSYSGGRDQEDQDLKSARQIVHETLSHKNPSQQREMEWLKGKSACLSNVRP